MAFVFLLEQVLNGLLVGAYYLLIALGLSLIFSLGGIVNLSHGAFYAVGAYLAVTLTSRIGFAGAFVASPLLVALLGVVIERLLFRRFYRADPILSLLLTFGLAMIIEQSLRIIFGAAPLPFPSPRLSGGRSFSAASSIRATVSSSSGWRSQLSSRPGSWFIAPPSAVWSGPECKTRTWWERLAFRFSRT